MFDIKKINFYEFLKEEIGENKFDLIVEEFQERLLEVDFEQFIRHYKAEQKLAGKNTKHIGVLVRCIGYKKMDIQESNPLMSVKILRDFKIEIEKNGHGIDKKNTIKKARLNHAAHDDQYFEKFFISINCSYDFRRQVYKAYLDLVYYFHYIYSGYTWIK